MFEELTALFEAITSTFSVHSKSMAVSNFFTSVGLIDNEWRDDARPRHCPLKQEFWHTNWEYNQEMILETTIDITLIVFLLSLHYPFPS